MKPKSFDVLYCEAESHDDYWIAGIVQEFTEEVSRLMEEREISRSELARRLGTSPAYVTKILRGNANFTLASMAKLSRALGAELRIELTPLVERDQGRGHTSSRIRTETPVTYSESMAARPASR